MKAFCSWSGGKDSALALKRANQIGNIQVTHCLNMINEDGNYSRSHGIRVDIIAAQVQAMNLELLQQSARWENYEEKFKLAVGQLKEEGIEVGIFGDIDIEPHREWVERVCGEMGIKAFLPLWQGNRQTLLEEFIDLGFEGVVTACNRQWLGEDWLGRAIDRQFITDLSFLPHIDLCGEKGEYHTLVTNGPLFFKRINILEKKSLLIEDHWFLNITGYRMEEIPG